MSKQNSGRKVRTVWSWPAVVIGAAFGAGAMLGGFYFLRSAVAGPEAWLGFAGSLLGVSLAVFGAVYVEDRKRSQEAVTNTSLLVGALEDLQKSLRVVEEGDQATAELIGEYRQLSKLLLARLREAAAVVDYARANSRLETAEQVLSMHRLEKELERVGQLVREEEGWIDGDEPSLQVMNIFLGKVESVTEQLNPRLKQALESLAH